MIHGWSLATPWALLLLPLPLLVALWRLGGAAGTAGLRISDGMRQRIGAASAARRPPSRMLLARWAAYVLVAVALAGPRSVASTPALPATGRDIELVLDLSGSMVAADMLDAGKPISRIALLKKDGTELIRRRAGDRVGLVIFAERALAAAPLSFDISGVARILDRVEIGLVGRSTAIGEGLGIGVKRLSESRSPTRIIILLSDGSNNAGTMDPIGVTALARSLGIKVYTIGYGPNETLTPRDDPDSVDFVALQKIAAAGGGEAFRVRNGEDFDAASRKIEALIAGEAQAPPAVIYAEFWPFPAGAAALVLFGMVAASRRAGRVGRTGLAGGATRAQARPA